MSRFTLLYDEDCGFCTSIVQWVSRQKRGNRIHVMPCQFALLTKKFPVTEKDCTTSIQLFDDQGNVTTKGQAVGRVLGILWNNRWPERIVNTPVLKQAIDLGYTFIAVNRHRLPGIKQWCAAGENSSCSIK